MLLNYIVSSRTLSQSTQFCLSHLVAPSRILTMNRFIVDVQFETNALPPILNALEIQDFHSGCLILEVTSHHGENSIHNVSPPVTSQLGSGALSVVKASINMLIPPAALTHVHHFTPSRTLASSCTLSHTSCTLLCPHLSCTLIYYFYLMSNRVVMADFAMQLFWFIFTCVVLKTKKVISNIFCVTRGLLWNSGKLCTE